MKDKELLRRLIQDGWRVILINGSHHILEKNGQIEVVPVR